MSQDARHCASQLSLLTLDVQSVYGIQQLGRIHVPPQG